MTTPALLATAGIAALIIGLCIYGPMRAKAEPPSRNIAGVVYVIAADVSGPVKIGITTRRRLKARLREIQNGNPHSLEIYATYRARDPRKIEKAAHRMLKRFRTEAKREWYAVSVADARRALNIITGETKPGIVPAISRWWLKVRVQ